MILSIITINYNNKAGLQKTIDSVITQTFKDFEWIIIDGGSTDGSKELIEQYSQYITYWVSEPDNGIYHAMNKGIQIAKGEYLYFLNSGDYLTTNKILKTVFQQNHTTDAIYGNIIYDNNTHDKNINLYSNYVSCSNLLTQNIHHQSIFYAKKLFDKYGYYDERLKILADWKFNLITIGLNQCSIKYLNYDIAYFDKNGISNNSQSIRKEESNLILNNLFPPGVLTDYKFYLQQNEIRKFFVTRILFSFLYRITLVFNNIYSRFLKSNLFI